MFGPRSVPATSSCSEAIAEHLADRRLEAPGRRADDCRLAADRVDAVVVDVLVGDEQEVDAVLGIAG